MSEAYARSTDPDTSHEAAASVRGAVANHREQMVIDSLFELGPSTANEVVEHLGGGAYYQSITPRFKPLEKKGLIRRTGEKRSNPGGRQAEIWDLT
jgi:hypothetical protein